MHLPILFYTFSNFGFDLVADFGLVRIIWMSIQCSKIPVNKSWFHFQIKELVKVILIRNGLIRFRKVALSFDKNPTYLYKLHKLIYNNRCIEF